ncbi:MAG: amidase [Alphaproteobacteria bacterium]|jgi:Asp-tRNA(Asn)/Glu-tRNA(Gln) amidotransferase A subunit family amidase|nr:amidase [Alphaproteobacteria bacterium]
MIKFDEYRKHDAVALADLVAKGEVSAEELLDAAVDRAEAVNPSINAIVYKQYDVARQAIRDGLPNGPLKGVPYLFKDLGAYDAGHPSTGGSRLFADFVPDHDATYTERCKAAGLVVMGRTNTPEFGLNISTESALLGACRNPWNLEHSTGGSSGGAAAAVAVGILPVAHATDGGGSIRIPAANCGLFGLKPTRGRNPAGPDVGEGWAGMSCGHVVSRSVRDSALMLDCTHGAAPGDPYAAPAPDRPFVDEVGVDPDKLRIAVMNHGHDGEPLSVECSQAVSDTAKLLTDLGHTVEAADPGIDTMAIGLANRAIIAANTANMVRNRAKALGREPSGQDVEAATWAMVQLGNAVAGPDYADAVLQIHLLSRKLGAFFQDYDLILSSTLRNPPLPLGTLNTQDPDGIEDFGELIRHELATTPFYNAAGCPAMTVPLHWSADVLPVGVHFGAALGDEATLLRVAAQLEQAKPWFDKMPDM